MMKPVLFPPCEVFILTAITQACEGANLKLPISAGPADWVGFAPLGRGGGKMRGLAQDFYWKTLKASATRSAVPPGAGVLGFVVGRG